MDVYVRVKTMKGQKGVGGVDVVLLVSAFAANLHVRRGGS